VTSQETARILFEVATVPFIVAGSAHALAALVDVRRPTFFTPTKEELRAATTQSGIRLRAMFPGGDATRPSMWRAWLGFNLSHGLGAATFGLLYLVLAVRDFEFVSSSDVLMLLALIVSAAYFILSLRFWFYGPAILTGAGMTCFALANVLS
jgi:hypothetical protein